MRDYIFIEGLRVDAMVGIYPRERGLLQTLEIDLKIGMPSAVAGSDDITHTIDYDKVSQRLREAVGGRQFNLLESLGEFIASLLFDEFGAPNVYISISKLGVLRGVRRVGVVIERSRPD